VKIASIQTTFLEVPGQVSVTVFTQGCSIKCSKECHNPKLIPFENDDALEVDPKTFGDLLVVRKMHDWVCFVGGEPTDQPDLYEMCNVVRHHGKLCALYTGRAFEEIPSKIVECLSFIKSGPYDGKDPFDRGSSQEVRVVNTFLDLTKITNKTDVFNAIQTITSLSR